MKWAFTILLLFLFLVSGAQVSNTVDLGSGKASHTKKYSEKLVLKFFGVQKSNQIGHYDNWTQRYIYYRPNENFNLGLGFVYKWLGLDLAFSFPFINDDDAIFVKTSRLDLQSSIFLRRFVIDVNLQTYKGYYGFNAVEYIDGFDPLNPNYPIRPDIRTRNFAVNGLYIFKPERFSYRAAFIYNERQIKSGGSFLAGTYFSYFKMNGDSTIVPLQVRDVFNPEPDFRNTTYISTGLSGGYGHTFIIAKKVFFSLSIAIGFGPTFKSNPDLSSIPGEVETRVAARASVRTALGYSSDRFFAGISAFSTQSSEVDETMPRLERNINNFKIFVGRRIGAPGFLQKLL